MVSPGVINLFFGIFTLQFQPSNATLEDTGMRKTQIPPEAKDGDRIEYNMDLVEKKCRPVLECDGNGDRILREVCSISQCTKSKYKQRCFDLS